LVESPGPIVSQMAADDLIEEKLTHLQTLIGHCGQRVSWGSQFRGLSNISELRRKARRPAFR
jgi:hypothetical protein